MSRPIGSVSSSVEINFEVGEQFDAPKPKGNEQANSAVEQWRGEALPTFAGATSEGPMISGQDLAAQSAREAANLKKAKTALDDFEAPIAKLAVKYPDPVSYFGNLKLGSKEIAFGAFGDVVHGKAFDDAAARLSTKDVRTALGEKVKKAWPHCSPKEVEQLQQFFMREVKESLREGVAPRLQETATRMLDGAAKSFEKTASDPTAVAALATKLTKMAQPLADVEDQASVRDLRIALGLDPDKMNVSSDELTTALEKRAAVLHQEAQNMSHHGRQTLFRALADQDVGALYKESKGIREGSLLAAQVDAVRTVGEEEKATISHVKLASVVAAAALTGGLGIAGLGGGALGAGVSLSIASPSVLQAWQEIDTAKAGESAGTMRIGAQEDAQRKAVIETGAAVLSAATAVGVGHALHGVVEGIAEPLVMHNADFVVKAVAHGLVEGGVELAFEHEAEGLAESLASEGRATGKNALERAKQ